MAEIKERLLQVAMEAIDKEADSMLYRFSVASEYPVAGWGENEILLHTRDAINLERLPGMLMAWEHNHDPAVGSEPLGKVTSWDITDKKSVISMRWANTELAKKYKGLVDDGIITNVSIRYTEDASIESDGNCIITRWTPIHCSLVSDPADPSVGYGRAYKSNIEDTKPAPSEDAAKEETPEKDRALSTTKEGDMENNLTHPIEPTPEPVQPAQPAQPDFTELRQQEMTRVRSITAMGQRHNLAILAEQLIDGGKSVEEARSIFDRELTERNNQKPLSKTPAGYLPGFDERDNRSYSLLRAIRSLIPGEKEFTENTFEKEVSASIQAKVREQTGKAGGGFYVPWPHLRLLGENTRQRSVINTDVPSQGGYLVDTELRGDLFIDLLRKKSSVLSAGATFLGGLTGNLSIPRQTSGSSFYWFRGNRTIGQTTMTFDEEELSIKNIGAIMQMTREQVMQSSIDIENLARMDLAANIALALDYAAINGAGDDNEPLGILQNQDITNVPLGTNGAALTWSDLVTMRKTIKTQLGDTGTLGWIMPSTVEAELMTTPMQTSGVEGNFILKPEQTSLIRAPFEVSEQMPTNLTKGSGTNLSSLIYGCWSEMIIANWGSLAIDINTQGDTWRTGGVEVRAIQSADIGYRHTESFVKITDIITS
jgi:HK97 family phage major capsid protein